MKTHKQFHDRRGVPIYPGDLLKSLHFVGARKKRYYLYHVVVEHDGHLEMVPPNHLAGGKGGRCWLSETLASQAEVIQGYGPGKILSFEDRPRRRMEPVNP